MIKEHFTAFLPEDYFGAITEVSPIITGLSGAEVYSVTTIKGEYILRFLLGDHAVWKKAIGVQRLASEAGISPELHSVDEAHKATVVTKISGISFGAAVSQPTIRAAAFASLLSQLRALHQLKAHGLTESDPILFARSLWLEQERRPGIPGWMKGMSDKLTAIETQTKHDRRRVLSHCDLNPANILWDGTKVWLIDWDGASLAHPYLDLAVIANFLSLPAPVGLELLAAQEQAPIELKNAEIFGSLRDLARIVYGGVFLRLIPDLTAVTFAPPDQIVPLSECFTLVASGKLKIDTSEGQAMIAAAFLTSAKA